MDVAEDLVIALAKGELDDIPTWPAACVRSDMGAGLGDQAPPGSARKRVTKRRCHGVSTALGA